MKNKKWKSFVIPFVLTILIYRISLFLINPGNFEYNDKFHHAYIGILILFVTGLIYEIKKRINMVFFGIGMGMLIDEIFYFFSKGNQYQRYWSDMSLYGTAGLMIITILVYISFNNLKLRKN